MEPSRMFDRHAPDAVHAALKAAVVKPTTGSLWGRSYQFTPALCGTAYGDGKALIGLTTINSRPRFYVIRVDSSWSIDLDRPHSHGPDFGDFVDDILQDLEEEFGSGRPFDGGDDEDDTGEDRDPWPALDDRDGCSWWREQWPIDALALLVKGDAVLARAVDALADGRPLSVATETGASLNFEPERFRFELDGEPFPLISYLVLAREHALKPTQHGWTDKADFVLSPAGLELATAVAELVQS